MHCPSAVEGGGTLPCALVRSRALSAARVRISAVNLAAPNLILRQIYLQETRRAEASHKLLLPPLGSPQSAPK